MMANSPAAVAAAFCRSSKPTLPGERFWAAIPEPITSAARKALPSNSAISRRHKTTSYIGGDPAAVVETRFRHDILQTLGSDGRRAGVINPPGAPRLVGTAVRKAYRAAYMR